MCAIEVKLVIFQIGCYNFRILYIILTVTTKKISKGYTQKEMRRESKGVMTSLILNTENSQIHRDRGIIVVTRRGKGGYINII